MIQVLDELWAAAPKPRKIGAEEIRGASSFRRESFESSCVRQVETPGRQIKSRKECKRRPSNA